MFWTKVLSWMAGRWLVLGWLVFSAACLAGTWVTATKRANAAWEARWAAAEAKARDEAARVTAAHNARLLASNGALKDAQEHIAARDTQLGLLAGRLRDLATAPRRVPVPADGTRCVAELAAERDRAEALGQLLVRGSDLARTLAAERDDAVARLWAIDEAWPR